MPKLKIIQSNFASGELSPRGWGRVDIARYPNAAKVLSNVISRTLGGAEKRPGLEWITTTKHQDKRARLIPYIISRDSAYMIEMGDQYARVFKSDGTQVMSGMTPYEITTPYTEALLANLDYAQSEDAMFMFNESVYPNRLRTFADNKWDCSPAPFTTTPFSEQGLKPAANLTLSSNTVGAGRTMTASAGVFMASDVGRAILRESGIAVITAFTSATDVTVEVKVVFESTSISSGSWTLDSSPQTTLTPSVKGPVGAAVTMTLSADGWRSGDVGKFVRINSGLVKLTAVSTATGATGTVIKELSATTAAPGLSWTLESSSWNADNGYPRTGTMHEQRLVAAGTPGNPQTVFGSRSGEPLDFTIGTNDDDAFIFTLTGSRNQVNQIAFIVSARNLIVLTYGGEYSMQSGVEKPITPTNVQIKSQSPHGSANVRPIQVARETLFIQRAGKRLRATSYHYDEDGYKSPDISTLADHLTYAGIAEMALQQEPDPIVWIVLNNGGLISVTLDRDLDIIAWNRHETDGAVESVATIPSGDSEQVWMIVRRVVGGNTVRYIERLQPHWYPIYGQEDPDNTATPPEEAPFKWGFTLDCAVTQDDAIGKATWDGLDHLEGKEVRCIADGVDMPPMTVTGGQVTLPREAKRVLIGLMFEPTITLLTPEIQAGTGSVQADSMSTNELVLRFFNTISATVEGDQAIPGRVNGPDQLDMPPALFTGDVSISKIGWDKKSEITIGQPDPFPFHLLAAIRSLTINGG